jgi:hypothetical protein
MASGRANMMDRLTSNTTAAQVAAMGSDQAIWRQVWLEGGWVRPAQWVPPTDTTTLTSTTMRRRRLIREIAGGLIDPMIGLPGLSWATAIYGVAANSSAQDDYAHRVSSKPTTKRSAN